MKIGKSTLCASKDDSSNSICDSPTARSDLLMTKKKRGEVNKLWLTVG